MNQLKAGAALSYVLIFVNIVIGVLYTPFMLRMLGQSEYGLYSLASSVIAYLTVLDLGFANAIVRYTAKFRAEGKQEEQWEMFGMFMRMYVGIGAIALLMGLLMMFNVESLFGQSMNSAELKTMQTMMALMAFNLAFTFPLSIYGAIITAYENFVFQKVINIIRVVLNPIVMIALLLLGYKAVVMVIVTTVFNLVTLLINCWYCHNRLYIKIVYRRFNIVFLKEVSTYSFWIFLNAIMDRLYWGTGQFILGIYKGAATVAIYSVAMQLQIMYFMFSTAISGVFLPKVTAMITNSATDKEVSDLFIRTGRIQYIIMSFVLSAFIILGRPFIIIWAGADYEEAYIITVILFIATLIPLIQNLGITILQARNQMKFRSLLFIILSVISVVISISMAQRYGGIGCAIATSFALIMGQGLILNMYYSIRIKLNIIGFWREILKMSLVPVLLTVIGLFIVNHIDITSFMDFTLAAFVYTALFAPLFWFFSMNKYERDLIGKPIQLLLNRFQKV